MKKLFTFLALILVGFTACNPAKIVTTKDAVKAVGTTTADFFTFIHNGRPGTIKDTGYFLIPLIASSPNEFMKFVPGEGKDLGYWIPAPAKADSATALAPEGGHAEEIELRLGDLRHAVFPKRGN